MALSHIKIIHLEFVCHFLCDFGLLLEGERDQFLPHGALACFGGGHWFLLQLVTHTLGVLQIFLVKLTSKCRVDLGHDRRVILRYTRTKKEIREKEQGAVNLTISESGDQLSQIVSE